MARCQSAVQGLYNPDRYRAPMIRQGGKLVATTWDKALAALAPKLRGAGASALFLNRHELGSFPAFLDTWLAGFGMPAHLSFDPEASFSALSANGVSSGSPWTRANFGAARLILSFGADFLDGGPGSTAHQLDWADARAKLEGAPRLIYIGPRRSLTGLNADEWIPAKAGSEIAIVNLLRGQVPAAQAAQLTGVDQALLTRLAQDVTAAGAGVVALAGATDAGARELAIAVAGLNQAAGAPAPTGGAGLATFADLRDVARRLNDGQVSLFMVRGANPAYATPKALGFAAAMAKATNTFKVSFSSYPDETSELCDLVLPDHHALESWGDAEAGAGMIALQQPAMEPVFDTRQTADVLIALARADGALVGRYPQTTYREWLMGRFPGGAAGWSAAAPKGIASGAVLASTATRSATPVRPTAAAQGDFDVVIYPSPVVGAGDGANKPWLQELSDPVTKLSWQSWVELHPMTAKRLGVENGDHLTVQTAAGSVTAPAYIYPGVRPDTVAIPLGQGHTAYGRYARGIGVNALDLVSAGEDGAGGLVLTTKARVTKAAGHSALVTTEGSARQHGRGIGQAIAVTELGAAAAPGGERAGATAPERGAPNATAPGAEEEERIPGEAKPTFLPGLRSPVAGDAQGNYLDSSSKDLGMYNPNHPTGMAKRRWAMTIDLARCTGCSACITACYAENNLPTVGAPWQGRALAPGVWDETPGANIIKGREMTWIRLERYYEGAWGDLEHSFDPDFDTRFVPMLCQHCGNAPCEPVCPVFATYHSPDGLNVQVYNRCVGTRYCSNNCPYKVRYFNWFGYGEPERRQYAWPEPMHWQLNPDVTVRGKGVMEKCTFCVQRIREAENRAKLESRELQADEFTTACAQACPSRAITFGDAADPNWTVAQLANDRRAYHVFEELNTFTAVVYLKKVTHPAAVAPATA
jgi:molybdopterin-containing oxidoreductase family iron-sulfur binding subunit